MTLVGWAWPWLIGAAFVSGGWLWWVARRRSQPQSIAVAFAGLWQRVLAQHAKRHPLRRYLPWLQLILQGLAAAALILAAGDPRSAQQVELGRDVLIVLDRSASMDLRDQAGPTRLERARALLHQRLQHLSAEDRLAIVDATLHAPLLLPWQSATQARHEPLDDVFAQPRAYRADFAHGLTKALSLVNPDVSTQIVLLSDGAGTTVDEHIFDACPQRATLHCQWQLIGDEQSNSAITRLGARRAHLQPESLTVTAEIANYTLNPSTYTVRLAMDGVVAAQHDVAIDAGQLGVVNFVVLAEQVSSIQVTVLDAKGQPLGDAVPHDDVASFNLPPRTATRIALIGASPNLFVQAALLALDQRLELVTLDDRDVAAGRAELRGFDAVVFDASVQFYPSQLEVGHALAFVGDETAARALGLPFAGSIEHIRLESGRADDPLLNGLSFADVNVAKALRWHTTPDDHVLAHVAQQAIVMRTKRQATDWTVVGFDPKSSDLPLRTAFPLLFANWLDHARPAATKPVVAQGAGMWRSWSALLTHLTAFDDASPRNAATVVDRHGRVVAGQAALAERSFDDVPQPGHYTVRHANGDDEPLSILHGDPIESDFRRLPIAMRSPADEQPLPDRSVVPWQILSALAGLVIAAEAVVAVRRWR